MKYLLLLFIFCLSVLASDFDPKNFKFESGQIIAISEAQIDGSTFIFEIGTGSRYGHIGIIMEDNKKFYVYESAPPQGVQKTPLKQFLEKSKIGNSYAVTIAEPEFNPLRISELKDNLDYMVSKKIKYNFKQQMNPNSLNCSEFVYTAFKEVDLELAPIETLKDLNLNAFDGLMYRAARFKFTDESRFVSPAGIIRSEKTKVLASNLPHDRILTESEILKAWIETDSIKNAVYVLFPHTRELSSKEFQNVLEDEILPYLKQQAGVHPYKILNCNQLLQ